MLANAHSAFHNVLPADPALTFLMGLVLGMMLMAWLKK